MKIILKSQPIFGVFPHLREDAPYEDFCKVALVPAAAVISNLLGCTVEPYDLEVKIISLPDGRLGYQCTASVVREEEEAAHAT
jgi:hypothetical protein